MKENLPKTVGHRGVRDHNPPKNPSQEIKTKKNNCKYNNIFIATLNTRSLKTQERLYELDFALQQIKWDIIGLSEIRRSGEQIEEYDNYIFYFKNITPGLYGVGFIIKKHLKDYIQDIIGISDRIAILNIKLSENEKPISIIQVYAPTEHADEEQKDLFYQELNQAMEQVSKTVIIMGDLNAQIGKRNKNEDYYLGPYSFGKRNNNGHRLIEFVQEFNLRVMNSYFNKKSSRKWTWISPNGKVKNEIDFIITNKPKLFTDVGAINQLEFNTDHRMLRGTLSTTYVKKSRKFLTSTRGIVKLPDTVSSSLKLTLQDKIQQIHTIQEKYDILETQLKSVESNVHITKSAKDKIGGKARDLILLRHSMRQQKPIDRNEITKISKQINSCIRNHRQETRLNRIMFHLETTGGVKKAQKEIQDCRNWIIDMKKPKQQKSNTKRTEILGIATDFYRELSNDEYSTQLEDLNHITTEEKIPFITKTEITRAIQSQIGNHQEKMESRMNF